MTPAPSLGEIYWSFFFASARGFGGMLPWGRRLTVEEKRWLTPQEFTNLFSLCHFLPGPNIINLTVVVGARFRGAAGALAAFTGLMTLPLIVVLVLAHLYARFGNVPAVDAVLRGLMPAAAGLVIGTGLKMAAPMIRSPRAVVFLVVTFAGAAVLRLPLLPLLLALAPLGVAAAWSRRP